MTLEKCHFSVYFRVRAVTASLLLFLLLDEKEGLADWVLKRKFIGSIALPWSSVHPWAMLLKEIQVYVFISTIAFMLALSTLIMVLNQSQFSRISPRLNLNRVKCLLKLLHIKIIYKTELVKSSLREF